MSVSWLYWSVSIQYNLCQDCLCCLSVSVLGLSVLGLSVSYPAKVIQVSAVLSLHPDVWVRNYLFLYFRSRFVSPAWRFDSEITVNSTLLNSSKVALVSFVLWSGYRDCWFLPTTTGGLSVHAQTHTAHRTPHTPHTAHRTPHTAHRTPHTAHHTTHTQSHTPHHHTHARTHARTHAHTHAHTHTHTHTPQTTSMHSYSHTLSSLSRWHQCNNWFFQWYVQTAKLIPPNYSNAN